MYTGGLFVGATVPLSLGRKHALPGRGIDLGYYVRHSLPSQSPPSINCKLRWSFYYFRRGVCDVGEIDSSVHSLVRHIGCSRIAGIHLVYLTRRIIFVISRPPRLLLPYFDFVPTENIRNSRIGEAMNKRREFSHGKRD